MPASRAPDRRWLTLFGLFSALLFAIAGTLAAAKPFWHDEIYTILFAGLPSVSTMWRAAHDGIDLSPPLNAILTHGVASLVGVGRLTTRLVPLLGFWAM